MPSSKKAAIQLRIGKLVEVDFIAEKVSKLHEVALWGFLLLSVFAVSIPQASGQLQAPVRSFSPSEHGAKRQTWDIAQATDGTMAFANGAGVLLFDGVNWKLLPSPQGHTIRSVINHSKNGNWIGGSYDALYTWSEASAQLSNPKPQKTIPPPGPKEEWWHIVENPADSSQLFVQTFSRMASTKASPQDYAHPVNVPGNIMFATVVNDDLYLPVLEEGLFRYEANDWQLISSHPTLRSSTIVGITEGQASDELLIATRAGAIFSFRQNKLSAWPSTAVQSWTNSQLNKLIRLRDGTYALASIGNGVFILSSKGDVIAHYTKQSGLLDDTVLSLFEDISGDLWAGLDNGIAHIALSSGMRFYGQDLGTVYAILPRSKGKLLLGTNQGLYLCSPFQQSFKGPVDNTPDSALLSGQIWHLTRTAFGTIVGANDGTSLLDDKGTITPIGTLAGGWCWLMLDESYAIAGTYAGLEGFQIENGQWVSQGKLSGFDQPVQHLARDPRDPSTILANHPQEGLYSLTFDATKRSIRDSKLLYSGPGRLFIPPFGNTKDDVVYFNGDGAYHFRQSEIFFDSSHTKVVVELSNGTLALEASQLKYWSARRDTQAVQCAPNLEYPIAVQFPAGFLKSGRPAIAVGLTRGAGFLDTLYRQKQMPAVKPTIGWNGQKARTVSFKQARFDQAPKWSVRLMGIDQHFTPFSERAKYSYPFLPVGEYTLEWRNNSGQRGEIFLDIQPYWYESNVAYIFYLFLAGLAVWGLRIYYRRRLREQAHQAEVERERQLTAERLQTRAAELEAEVEISKRTVALKDAEVDHRNRELARTTMTLVRQNETLLRLKESLSPLPRTGEIGKAKRQSIRLIEGHLSDETDWDFFEEHFDAVHAGFLKKLHEQHPSLTPGDLRLAALLRLNLPSKEIAPLLHISIRGVENKRYRLRKKLGLPAEINLTAWVIDFV